MKLVKILTFTFALSIFSLQCSSDHGNYYLQALDFISKDDDLIEMLKNHNLYDPNLLYTQSELVYRVYPEKPGFFFQSFKEELQSLDKKIRDFTNLETSIDSTMMDYSISDTARVKIFFSERVDNMITSEVFFRKDLFEYEGFDDYHGNSMFNTAMMYLFTFKEGELDIVFKRVQQYE